MNGDKFLMELIKSEWKQQHKKEFVSFLENQRREEKIDWTKKIINTNMPVLAIKTPVLKQIAKEIQKGNYIDFLDLDINNYYENTIVNGSLICSIKNFEIMKKYLDKYAMIVDNWSSCNLLKFNVKNNEEKYWNLALEYIKSDYQFKKRIGIIILFEFINNDSYIDKIYKVLDQFKNEKAYYVNMANAWLVCELFIKRRDKTLKYLGNNKLNEFTLNKALSKCRDSFRVSEEDKILLLGYRRNKNA